MICRWFETEITQLWYDRLLCSVISALGFEPRNRQFGEAAARCWDGYGEYQFASVLSWVCEWDNQYSVVESGCSWPSTIWHIAVFRWFPLLDLNHGIDGLEKLQLHVETGMEDVNLHDYCSGYNCLICTFKSLWIDVCLKRLLTSNGNGACIYNFVKLWNSTMSPTSLILILMLNKSNDLTTLAVKELYPLQ